MTLYPTTTLDYLLHRAVSVPHYPCKRRHEQAQKNKEKKIHPLKAVAKTPFSRAASIFLPFKK